MQNSSLSHIIYFSGTSLYIMLLFSNSDLSCFSCILMEPSTNLLIDAKFGASAMFPKIEKSRQIRTTMSLHAQNLAPVESEVCYCQISIF